MLLATRRFAPLFFTQFLGAFNDNLFKNALVMLIAFKLPNISSDQAQTLIVLSGALFIFPYFVFSAMAGQLADKIDRARMARITKLWEIFIVLLGAIGFVGHHPIFLLMVLFALGMQSTFFSPIKYALLPQHLRDDELMIGNAFIEAGTFLAILLGTISGGVLVMQESGEWLIVGSTAVIALVGYIASRFIPVAPAPSPQLRIGYNIFVETWRMVANDRKNKRVFSAILAISWFWLVGAVFLSQFPTMGKEMIGSGEAVVTLFLAMFSVGIGIGSFLANSLSKGKITSRLTVPSLLALAIFTADLVWALSGIEKAAEPLSIAMFLSQWSHIRILVDLLAIAISAGVYIVPLYAIMQHDSAPESRARTIATNNVINAIYMVVSAVVTIVLLQAGYNITHIFALLAAGSLWVAMWLRGAFK